MVKICKPNRECNNLPTALVGLLYTSIGQWHLLTSCAQKAAIAQLIEKPHMRKKARTLRESMN